MIMFCMICEEAIRDKDGISNETIRDMTGIEKIEEFLREQRLRSFGHIERMDEKRAPVKAKKKFVLN